MNQIYATLALVLGCLILCAPLTAAPLAFAGFNDAIGLNADAIPNSPYQVGGPLGGRGGNESGWAGPWSGANAIQSAVVFEGDGAAQITPTSQVDRIWSEAATGHFRIEQYVRFAVGARVVAYIEQNSPSNEAYQGPIWQAFPDGKFYVIDGVGDGAAVAPREFSGFTWQPDVWYKVDVVGDVATQTWEFYVDDVRYAAPDSLGYRGTPQFLNRIRYLSEGSGNLFLDAVAVVPEPSTIALALCGAVFILPLNAKHCRRFRR